jgi:hypothetical protein
MYNGKKLDENIVEFSLPSEHLVQILPESSSGSVFVKNAGSGSVSGSAYNQCGSETLLMSRKSGFIAPAHQEIDGGEDEEGGDDRAQAEPGP